MTGRSVLFAEAACRNGEVSVVVTGQTGGRPIRFLIHYADGRVEERRV